MLSEIVDSYCDQLPEAIPEALFKSAVGTTIASFLRSDSVEATVDRIFRNFIACLKHNCISVPIAGYVFSDKSELCKALSALAISQLGALLCARINNPEAILRDLFTSDFDCSSAIVGVCLQWTMLGRALVYV